MMTPDIVALSILQLKMGADDSNKGLTSYHLINGGH